MAREFADAYAKEHPQGSILGGIFAGLIAKLIMKFLENLLKTHDIVPKAE